MLQSYINGLENSSLWQSFNACIVSCTKGNTFFLGHIIVSLFWHNYLVLYILETRRGGGGGELMQVYCKSGRVVMLVTYIRDLYGTNVIWPMTHTAWEKQWTGPTREPLSRTVLPVVSLSQTGMHSLELNSILGFPGPGQGSIFLQVDPCTVSSDLRSLGFADFVLNWDRGFSPSGLTDFSGLVRLG